MMKANTMVFDGGVFGSLSHPWVRAPRRKRQQPKKKVSTYAIARVDSDVRCD